ncbi:acyl-CoA dehydrogenase [Alkalilimnicola ehrlichii]|uniref:Acyl-coenzyme A dehydrogenase n=1 Tax=Alkalilimnicola ehrlichii TaxID=351052 RepID=A0A3E0X155_9GAMM|nr:acyl-CoA dehydrogenase [Alkalilimnicola ehrlichii]RFA31052.1 acyl-CoA dehydrogenase [Alkalilimnicola ehrlichii]RFA39008.1 acyl-CoA dehydrogenase [Alkalilimnicola ehrlichii]
MVTLAWLVVLIVVVMTLAYHRAPLWLSTLAVAGYLAAVHLLSPPPIVIMGILWALFLAAAVLLNLAPLRRKLISNRVKTWFSRRSPHLSATERQALGAGTVWWDAELFSGRPRWKSLLRQPKPALSQAERAFLEGPTEELCRMLDEWRITETHRDLPPAVWNFLKEQGFMGLIIPTEYGGKGFSAYAHSQILVKVGSRSPTAGVTISVPNSLGPAELLLHHGTAEQREYYLPKLARGEEIPCFALTGPEAGSDAAAIPDYGVVCRGEHEGREIIGLRLNWDKRYITLAPVATLLGLAFKVYDPEQLLGGDYQRGISIALIPSTTPGVDIGHRHRPLEAAFMNGPTRGRNVFIPLDWVIGGEAGIGQGWQMLMNCLAAGRAISLPANACGTAQLATAVSGAYARIRRQFKRPISDFEGIQELLARMGGNTYMLDAARTLTTRAIDQGQKPAVLSAIVKYQLTERSRRILNDAMDIHAGKSICLGPNNYLARFFQSAPIPITVEGSNLLTRNMIIFGQGALRCHPFLLKEINAAGSTAPDAEKAFDRAFFGHIGLLASNKIRSVVLGVTDGRIVLTHGAPELRRHYQRLTRAAAAFAFVADMTLITQGAALKRRERLSARLGDALSALYLASAVLKRYENEGREQLDLPMVDWAVATLLYESQQALHETLRNFPNRPLGRLLRALVFPLGRRYQKPNDVLDRQVAELLTKPTASRDRLTSAMFRATDPDDPIARLEKTFTLLVSAAPIEQKLQAAERAGQLRFAPGIDPVQAALAAGIIDPGEAERLGEAIRMRQSVIMVDEFAASTPIKSLPGPV